MATNDNDELVGILSLSRANLIPLVLDALTDVCGREDCSESARKELYFATVPLLLLVIGGAETKAEGADSLKRAALDLCCALKCGVFAKFKRPKNAAKAANNLRQAVDSLSAFYLLLTALSG